MSCEPYILSLPYIIMKNISSVNHHPIRNRYVIFKMKGEDKDHPTNSYELLDPYFRLRHEGREV